MSGVLMAMVPAGEKLAGKDGWWVEPLTATDTHRNTVGAGLAMLEADIRNDESPLGWANFAAAAVGDGIAGNSGGYYDSTGFDWRRVAVETVINAGLAMAVGDKFGEDAGLNFFGAALGQTVTGMMGSKAQWEADYQRFSAGMSDEDARRLADLQQLPKAQLEALQRQAANNPVQGPSPNARNMRLNPATGQYEDETGRPMPAMVASNGMVTDALPEHAGFAAFETEGRPAATATGTYTIQSGDTLSVLAQKTGLSVEYLARLNGIENPDLIFAGSTLSGFSEDQLALLAGAGVSGNAVVHSSGLRMDSSLSRMELDIIAEAGRTIATYPVSRAFDSADPHQYLVMPWFDGTWNDRDTMDIDTNPAELQRLMEGQNRRVFAPYYVGVGTSFGTEWFGGATGAGMTNRMHAAYSDMVEGEWGQVYPCNMFHWLSSQPWPDHYVLSSRVRSTT